VAAITLPAVLTEVPVVLAMTSDALLGHLARAWRLFMAIGALQFCVRTQQREMRILGMIEHPDGPTVGRMAGLALVAQPILVHVVRRVAADATGRRLVEGQAVVTLHAAHDPMQAEQRKLGQIVLKHYVAAPLVLTMAARASAFHLPAVRILAAVTALTIGGQLCSLAIPVWQVWHRAWRAPLRGRIYGASDDRIHRMPAIVVVAILAFGDRSVARACHRRDGSRRNPWESSPCSYTFLWQARQSISPCTPSSA